MINNYFIDESFIVIDEEGPIKALRKSVDKMGNWNTSNDNKTPNKFTSNSVSDEDFKMMKDLLHQIKTVEDYKEYKKAFDKFCKFCSILPSNILIKKYELKEGKNGKNTIHIEYINNNRKIDLDEGTKLYHMSKVAGIKELIPAFRGKSAKGYLYDKPRIYFTIRKNMPKFLADYKPTEKVHLYLVKQPITSVYVDPLVWSYAQGAVYIETNKPVPVEELTNQNRESLLSKIIPNKESFDFEDFYQFVTENGLIIADDNE